MLGFEVPVNTNVIRFCQVSTVDNFSSDIICSEAENKLGNGSIALIIEAAGTSETSENVH